MQDISWTILLACALGACGISWSLVLGLIKWTTRHNILDVPNDRSSHTQPTPRGGGLAIAALCTIGLVPSVWLLKGKMPDTGVFVVLFGCLAVAAISWLDDLRPLRSWQRFSIHGLAALAVIGSFGYWDQIEVPYVGNVRLGLAGAGVTWIWIVGLTNAYNFMDGVDGIAGATAIVCGVAWTAVGVHIGSAELVAIGLLLSASALGFLFHNWSPASIFMGDVGSAFIGYILAVLPLMEHESGYRLPLVAILFVWPFTFDTTFTICRRALRHENILKAHRSHLYQRLVIAGARHQRVALGYAFLAAADATVGWAYLTAQGAIAGVAAMAVLALQGPLLVLYVRYRESTGSSTEQD